MVVNIWTLFYIFWFRDLFQNIMVCRLWWPLVHTWWQFF